MLSVLRIQSGNQLISRVVCSYNYTSMPWCSWYLAEEEWNSLFPLHTMYPITTPQGPYCYILADAGSVLLITMCSMLQLLHWSDRQSPGDEKEHENAVASRDTNSLALVEHKAVTGLQWTGRWLTLALTGGNAVPWRHGISDPTQIP